MGRSAHWRMSVRGAAAAVLVVLLAATGIIASAIYLNDRQQDEAREKAERAIVYSELYEDALVGAYDEWIAVIGYFVVKDPAYLDRFEQSRRQVEESLLTLRDEALPEDPARANKLDAYIETHDRFASLEADIIDALGADDLGRAVDIAVGTNLTVDADVFLNDLQAELDAQRAEMRAAQAQWEAAKTANLYWSLVIGGISLTLMALLGYAAYRWIGRAVLETSAATRAIAGGDVNARVTPAGPRELAMLGEDVNSMAEALIKRSDELNAYLSKDLESRTAELERANHDLGRALEGERDLERQLRHQAFHDPLTGLANRTRFMERLQHALERTVGRDARLAVLFMDMDDFKAVNDSLGHPAGDRLLVAVAERIEAALRVGDTAARFGGDEFAVLLEDIDDESQAGEVADRIITDLRQPVMLEEHEVFAHVSIGIVVADEAQTVEELLRRADVAMYVAKSGGKGQYAVYEPAMESEIAGRLQLVSELQRAIEREEFVLHYQPTIVVETGRVAGVEALLRWNHPTRGELHPDDFIPIAEKSGLIVPIGRWVLLQATAQARRWHEDFPTEPPLSLAVNVSPRQIQQTGFVESVAEALQVSGLDPASLVLELTETLMMQDTSLAIEKLNHLKSLGIRLAVDDFGTGYSSLSYLRKFPIDVLKIDRSFVDGVSRAGRERELAQSILELAQSLNLQTVAEGVESGEQLGWLRARHCDLAQGFYFSRAVPASELDAVLATDREAGRDIA